VVLTVGSIKVGRLHGTVKAGIKLHYTGLDFPIGRLAFCCLRLCLMGHVIGWVLGVGFEIELKDGEAGHLA
jgi:hypothetical protein